MKVLGIDPGFAFVGLGVLLFTPGSARVVHHETFKTTTKDDHERRLDAIADRILDVIDEHEPVAIGYENQAGVEAAMHRRKDDDEHGSNFSSRRVHEVSGIIRCAARTFVLPVYCLAPATAKIALLGKGRGRATKGAVKDGARVFFGVNVTEHAADAIAIAMAAGQRHRVHLMRLRAAKQLIR